MPTRSTNTQLKSRNTQQAPKRVTYATPKGRALFVHVVDPDYGTEKFPLKEGQYSLSLILDADASETLKALLADEITNAEDYAQEQFAGLKRVTREKLGSVSFNPVCEPVYDKNDEPTGEYRWRFKTGAFFEDRTTGKKRMRTIPLFDSLTQAVRLKEEPGNGTIVRVSFTCAPYFVEGQGTGGLSLYLSAVQILKLVRFGERDAASYGFTVDDEAALSEDGFTGKSLLENDNDDDGQDNGLSSETEDEESGGVPDAIPF